MASPYSCQSQYFLYSNARRLSTPRLFLTSEEYSSLFFVLEFEEYCTVGTWEYAGEFVLSGDLNPRKTSSRAAVQRNIFSRTSDIEKVKCSSGRQSFFLLVSWSRTDENRQARSSCFSTSSDATPPLSLSSSCTAQVTFDRTQRAARAGGRPASQTSHRRE